MQIHGGYGYSSEYLPEAWLRDQKLNSIHEGTTGIQSIDLLGRKVRAEGGAALELLGREIADAVEAARAAGVVPRWCDALESAFRTTRELTAYLGNLGDPEATLLHSVDYLDLFSMVVIAFMWLRMSTAAKMGLVTGTGDVGLYEGKLCAAEYFVRTELPRVELLASLCREREDSYARARAEWF